jgi:hypothetical protein
MTEDIQYRQPLTTAKNRAAYLRGLETYSFPCAVLIMTLEQAQSFHQLVPGSGKGQNMEQLTFSSQ